MKNVILKAGPLTSGIARHDQPPPPELRVPVKLNGGGEVELVFVRDPDQEVGKLRDLIVYGLARVGPLDSPAIPVGAECPQGSGEERACGVGETGSE